MSKLPKAIEAAAQVADEVQKGLNTTESQVTAEADATEVQEVQVETQVQKAQTTDPWEQKYKILQGKYSAEVPRLAQEKRQMAEQLKQVTSRLEELERAANHKPLVSDQDVQEYGEGLIEVIRKAAREEISAKDSEIEALKRKLSMVEDVTIQKTTDDFWKDLKRQVPDWEQINTQEAWLDWLGGMDDFAGRVRQDMLDEAQSARNADRVAKFFNAYKQQKGISQKKLAAELEQQVVPDSGAPSVAPSSSKLLSIEDVRRANIQALKGKITAAELEKIHSRFMQQGKSAAS